MMTKLPDPQNGPADFLLSRERSISHRGKRRISLFQDHLGKKYLGFQLEIQITPFVNRKVFFPISEEEIGSLEKNEISMFVLLQTKENFKCTIIEENSRGKILKNSSPKLKWVLTEYSSLFEEAGGTESPVEEDLNKKSSLSKPKWNLRLVLILLIGIALGLLFGLFGQNPLLTYVSTKIDSIVAFWVVLVIFFGLNVFLFYLFRRQIFQKVFKVGEASLEEIVNPLLDFTVSVANPSTPIKIDEGKKALRRIAAMYSSSRIRRAIISTTLSLIIAVGGFMGTIYVYQQTLLMGEQTKLIRKDNFLFESDRRAGLVSELTSIFEEIERQYEACAKLGDSKECNLTRTTRGRIIAVSNALKPYRYLNKEGNLIKEPTSPERGQLLNVLAGVLHKEDKAYLMSKINFSYADMSEIKSEKFDFSRLNLSNATFNDAELISVFFEGSNLFRSLFFGTQIKNCSFSYGCNLKGAVFSNCDVRMTNSEYSFLDSVEFSNSIFRGVSFHGSQTHHAIFSEVSLDTGWVVSSGLPEPIPCDFSNGDFRGTAFKDCQFKWVDCSFSDFRSTRFLGTTTFDSVNFTGSKVLQRDVRMVFSRGGDTTKLRIYHNDFPDSLLR